MEQPEVFTDNVLYIRKCYTCMQQDFESHLLKCVNHNSPVNVEKHRVHWHTKEFLTKMFACQNPHTPLMSLSETLL